MNETEEIATIDLSQCQTRTLSEHNNYNKTTYVVAEQDTDQDIYRVLGLDKKKFTVFMDIKCSYSDRNQKFVFRPGMQVYLYAREQDDRSEQHCKRLHVSIPNTHCKAEKLTFRKPDSGHYDYHTAVLTISTGKEGGSFHISCRPEQSEKIFGLSLGDQGIACMRSTLPLNIPDRFYQRYSDDEEIDFSLRTLMNLKSYFRQKTNVLYLMNLLKQREGMTGSKILIPAGNKKVLDQLLPFYEELLKKDEPLLLATFHTLVFESKRTINGVKVAKFFNEFFAPVRDLDSFKAKLQEIYNIFAKHESGLGNYSHYYRFEDIFSQLPGYTELRKQALRSQSGRALNKMVTDIEAINFDQSKYPLLAELINDGSIPVSAFFRKEGDESYFLFNDNWALYEEFLGRHREAGIELAKLASQRTTYEKSFMSYIYFVLYELPEYLKKHTGKAWTCLPSIIDSASELEPGSERGQTTKRRSALTPIVDNEACTVVVPYACLRVPGMSTIYTYSLNYSIVRRGLSIDGDVNTNDIEEKLNGRDDYGLMFYTLTGSAAGRGYPTFLIIFERLDDKTRVHFHRTHPLRSKDGDKNPVNNWIRTCYNWMVGNINLSGIKAQQGDLVFTSVDSLPEGEQTDVNSYDSHAFSKPVSFTPCKKKDSQNILGYFDIKEDVLLNHPEHRQRKIPAGLYELRQCRSWEANPRGIWTLRID